MFDLIIANEHVMLREALCELLQKRGNYNIVGQASSGDELAKLLASNSPDLVILDVDMPQTEVLAEFEKYNASMNKPPVLILSAMKAKKKVREAMEAGAKGYLPKNASLNELEVAINSILEGKTYITQKANEELQKDDFNSADSPLSVLTKREIEILSHLADGLPNREIGKMLHISTRTVDTHRSNILKKLKVKTNAELVKLALADGLISL